VKTDRKDARGIAQLLRMGWYRPVHAKSADAQEGGHCWSAASFCKFFHGGVRAEIYRGRFF
jgi:hypothetical protein